MKRIELSAALNACIDDGVRQKIAHKVGLPTQAIEQVFSRAGAMIIAALAARASAGRDETIAVFGALMSRDVNPRIREECAALADSTRKLKRLEHAGFTLVAHATGTDATELSDHVADQVGVPAQATCALTCVCAAILGGVIKHHILIEQGDVSELPGLLASQLATIADDLTEGSVAALDALQTDVNAFLEHLSIRLAAVTADFEPVRPRVGEAATPIQPAVPRQPIPAHSRYEVGKVYVNDIRFTSAMQPTMPMGAALAAGRRGKPKTRRVWKAFALTTVTIMFAVFVWVKNYHWPEALSVFARVTGETTQGKPTSMVSGVVSPSVKTASIK